MLTVVSNIFYNSPMNRDVNLIAFLNEIPLFKKVEPNTIKRIARNLQEKKLFRDETIALQDDEINEIFIIKEGAIEIFKISEEGKKLTLRILRRGEVFCLSNIFSNKAIHNYRAKEDSILYSIPSKAFKRLCEEDINLSDSVIEALVRNIIHYSALIERVKLMDGESCISSLLLAMQKNRVVRATQEELADMSGLCRETVSRLLKKLKNEGCVETHKGSIVIKNLESLKHLCS